MNQPVPSSLYLDHNATTPVEPEVAQAINRAQQDFPANPASQHQAGRQAQKALEAARDRIAELLGANLEGKSADRLVFTSGGTEANNLAVLGILRAATQREERPVHLLISSVEHASVFRPAERWLDEGGDVDLLGVDRNGRVTPETLLKAIRPATRLISVTAANHETGTIEPIAELARIAQEAGVRFHTDGVQLVGKRPVDFRGLGVDSLSLAAHKFHGPLGIGALLIRADVEIEPLLFGGHQQDDLRPGTESVALAVGMRVALERRYERFEEETVYLSTLRDRFERELLRALPELIVHGQSADRLPQTSNLSFPGVDGPTLFDRLDRAGIACSFGAACQTATSEPSPTLLAMGIKSTLAKATLRYSFGIDNTEADVNEAIRRVIDVYRSLQ